MLRSLSVPRALPRRPGPLAAGLLLLLALAGAPPAHAMSGTIDYSYTGSFPITVGNGETLTIADQGSVNSTASRAIVVDQGGTLNVTGGSVHGRGAIETKGTVVITGGSISGIAGVLMSSGTVTMWGGSLSGSDTALNMGGGTATIHGGSFSGGAAVYIGGGAAIITGGVFTGAYGVSVLTGGAATITGGTFHTSFYGVAAAGPVSIVGCGLQLDVSGQLTGALQDGTAINTPTYGLTPANLINTCPTAYGVNALFAQSGSGKAYKLGSTIPIKLQLVGASGDNVSSSALVVRALGLTQIAGGSGTATVLDPGNSNPDSDFRYDATLQGYILNLSTRNLGTGTWQLTFSVNGQTDPSYALTFVLR